MTRCAWCGSHPVYVAYHDEEWGVPEHDDRALYEKLVLDGFQAGLSWWSILSRREGFRAAFEGFHPEAIAGWSDEKLEALLRDDRIIRNRQKVFATRSNARAFLEIDSFSEYLWGFVDGVPIQNAWTDGLPAETELSKRIAKDLKRRGFKFCGPTIVYAFMQAIGMVNDHRVDCFRHPEVARLVPPGG